MANQKNNNNCFFTPHPLTKHYSRQPKPYNRSNQSKLIKQTTHKIKTNQIQSKTSIGRTNQRIIKSSPSNQKIKIKKLNQNKNNLNFNDFSLTQPTNLSNQIHHHPNNQIHRKTSPKIDQPDDRSSSLSSLTSEDDHPPSDQPIQSTSNNILPQSISNTDHSSSILIDKLSDQSPPHPNSPNLVENMDLDHEDDQPSELGEDVCLEYTDFGHDFGFPVTWSESEYDEDHEREDQKDEFAEFLLMDTSEVDQLFGFDQLESIRNSSKYNQMIHGVDQSENESDDNDSYLGYMVIEEFDPKEVVLHQTHDQSSTFENDNNNEEDLDNQSLHSQSISGDDGATTDSLDEDDHSGLVRFGIEADHSNDLNSEDDLQNEEEDARFFDLPPSSTLGSMLRNFDFSVTSTPVDSTLVDRIKSLPIEGEIKFPIMGTFSVNRKDRMNAGRTIIDEKESPPLSPFTGGKVIRYNRFKKLRQHSCTGDSEQSSLACTPKPDESQDLNAPGRSSNLGVTEDEFDITAFIRGISSIDEGCSDSEKKNAFELPTAELDGLTRWQRVPMSAFRRRMMMKSQDGKEETERLRLVGAIQTSSSLVETLSLCEQPNVLRKRHAPSKFLSSMISSNEVYDRNDHRRLRKTKSYNSNGKQSKLNHHKSYLQAFSQQKHQLEPHEQIIHQNQELNVSGLSTHSFQSSLANTQEQTMRKERDQKQEEGKKIQGGLNIESSLSGKNLEIKIFNQVLDIETLDNEDGNKSNDIINSSILHANIIENIDNIDNNHHDHEFNNFETIPNRSINLDFPPIF